METFGCQQIRGETVAAGGAVRKPLHHRAQVGSLCTVRVWAVPPTLYCRVWTVPPTLYCKSVGRPTHLVLRYPVWSHCWRCKIITAGILYTLRVDCPTHFVLWYPVGSRWSAEVITVPSADSPEVHTTILLTWSGIHTGLPAGTFPALDHSCAVGG